MFEVVIPFRPREAWDSVPDLLKVIDSLTMPYIISYFGGVLDERLESCNIVYTDTSEVWNRAKALNIGAAAITETDFIMPNDADCVWEEDMSGPIGDAFMKGCAPSLGVIYHGAINKNGYGMTGWDKQWPVRWDERYRGYGREDIDFKTQLEKAKIPIERIEGGVRHMSHALDNHPDLWRENKRLFNQKWR